LTQTSTTFNYLEREVPPGEENFLSLYYLNENDPDSGWQLLETSGDSSYNIISARTEGPGLYALMGSIPIPLAQTGWNLVAYPVQETRPVTEALASLYDPATDTYAYAMVYGYDPNAESDPWQVYAPQDVPDWVNDLPELRFNQVYWISATQVTTWFVSGGSEAQTRPPDSALVPPATYYGEVLPGETFSPLAGMTVHAFVTGQPCGQGRTQLVAQQITYSINVFAAEPGQDQCGRPGRTVNFTVDGMPMETAVPWQNDRIREVDLILEPPGQRVYLPLILK